MRGEMVEHREEESLMAKTKIEFITLDVALNPRQSYRKKWGTNGEKQLPLMFMVPDHGTSSRTVSLKQRFVSQNLSLEQTQQYDTQRIE